MTDDLPGVASLQRLRAGGRSPADIRRAVRAADLVRAHRGVYLDASPPTELTLIAAALVHAGPESTAVVSSALRIHGIGGIVGDRVPEIAVPPGLEKHQRSGLSLHFWDIPLDQRTVVGGLPVTTIARTLADAVRLLPRMQAVACVDSAMSQHLIAPESLDQVARLLHRRRHCVSGRTRLGEARFDAQSPLETRVRLRADDAGLRPDALQVPIYDHDELLGFGDMGYRLPRGGWLIVEADGRSVHERPEALLRDRERQNAFLARARAMIVRFTWEDASLDHRIPDVVRPILRRAGWRPSPRRP
jgi:hypothetical protein